MLKRLQEQGITILVSTPYMDEAGLCDRVALIQEGHVMDVDSPTGIIEKYEWPLLAVKTSDMYHLLYDLEEFPSKVSVYRFGEKIHLSVSDRDIKPGDVLSFLENKGRKEIEADFVKPNVEDCFMALMNK